jgi:hypothetical protein
MNSKEILFADTLDINAAINGGLADAGVTYEVPHLYADYVSVDPVTGVVTPNALPPSGVVGVVVNILNGDGDEIGHVMLEIRQAAVGNLEIGFSVSNLAVLTALDANFDQTVSVSWENLDITTQIEGYDPNQIWVRRTDTSATVVTNTVATAGSIEFDISDLSPGDSVTFEIFTYLNSDPSGPGPVQATVLYTIGI